MSKHANWAVLVTLCVGMATSAVSSQTPQLKVTMREKLEHSQALLAAVVTSDWNALERHSKELERISRGPAWSVLKTPEYLRRSAAFLSATEDLIEAAAARDLKAAPLAYVTLTLTCVQCHQHIAGARLAQTLR